MKALINALKGFKATKQTVAVVVLIFVLNLAFSVILAVPMYHSLKESFGDSLVGENMAEGFDMLWWEEYKDQSEGFEKTFVPSIIGKGAILNNLEGLVLMTFLRLPPAILILGLLYILLRTFLAAGILSTFHERVQKFSLKRFFGEAADFFFRFFVVTLLSLVFFFGLLVPINRWFQIIRNNVAQHTFSEITPFILGLFFSTLMLFLIFFLQMAFDYIRIQIVVEERTDVLTAVREGVRFILRHPGSTLALFYILVLINLGITIVYLILHSLVPQTSFVGVFVSFLIQQVFIFAIIFNRCWLYAGEIELYKYWR